MGSSGSGMFGTYRDGGAGSITNGKNNSDSECPLEIQNIRLEDVATSEYFLQYDRVPSQGELIELSAHLVNKRLVVMLTNSQEVIGNLPVTYNYLNLCLKKGMKYSGTIKSTGMSPIPYIVVDLHA